MSTGAWFCRRHCQRRAQFSDQFTFGLVATTEILGPTEVDQQHHCQFPFFAKQLDIGLVAAGGNVQIDGADVVANLVGSHLFKLDAPAFEGGMPGTGQQFVDLVRRSNLNASDFLNDFTWDHE